MASLALAVALIMISLWGLAGLSLLLTFLGFRVVGAALGLLSAAAGVWLLFILPHAPFFGLVNLVAGVVSIRRYLHREEE